MAGKLVTQVRNPDDPVELDEASSTYVDVQPNEEDLKQHPPSKCCARCDVWCTGCWAWFISSFTCCPCCKQKAKEAEKRGRSFSLPGRRPGQYLLPSILPKDRRKKTLVLDLDETLVHSSFKPVPNADFVLSIELEGETHHVYVLKRPGVDEFLEIVGAKFEVVVFTASLSKYADPLLDILDPKRLVRARLFREACVQHYHNYVKDLSQLGRDLKDIIIIDNSPYSYIFQPDNALPISSWFNDMNDRQLYEIMPVLDALCECENVCPVLANREMILQEANVRRLSQTSVPPSPQSVPSLHSQAPSLPPPSPQHNRPSLSETTVSLQIEEIELQTGSVQHSPQTEREIERLDDEDHDVEYHPGSSSTAGGVVAGAQLHETDTIVEIDADADMFPPHDQAVRPDAPTDESAALATGSSSE